MGRRSPRHVCRREAYSHHPCGESLRFVRTPFISSGNLVLSTLCTVNRQPKLWRHHPCQLCPRLRCRAHGFAAKGEEGRVVIHLMIPCARRQPQYTSWGATQGPTAHVHCRDEASLTQSHCHHSSTAQFWVMRLAMGGANCSNFSHVPLGNT